MSILPARHPSPRSSRTSRRLALPLGLALLLAACAPAAPSPTAAPPKPTEAPRPAPTVVPTRPAEKPAEAKPTAKPTAKPAEAKPAPKPAAFDEKAVADFYRGKTVRVIVGFAPGGSFDVSSRILAKALPKYLPGSPTTIVENKPGAGTMLAANLVSNVEPKDGTVIASINEYLPLQQAIGAPGIEFDAARMQWLGAGNKTFNVCVARLDSGVSTFQDTLAGKELVLGTTGRGSNVHDVPAVLSAVFGAKFKLVPGYDGVVTIRRAVQANEVSGYCQTFDTLTTVMKPFMEGEGRILRVLIAMGSELPDHPYLKDVPAAEKLARSEEDRALLRAVNAPALITRPLMVAPEVPRDRVEALRQAVARAFADPEVQAELKQAGVDGIPSTGEEVAQVVRGILSTPPAVLTRLKDILK